jgi:predicted DCC family thiol-disulfide oxidoreductase YuxK
VIGKIVIFDGDCAFCNRSVLFILKNSKKEDIYVCSGDSDAGRKLIVKHNISLKPEETLIFIDNNAVYGKSNAALNICKYLKIPYSFLIIFKIIPKYFRDKVYDFIAKRRKRIIKDNSCSFELASTYKDKVIK